MHIVLIEGPRPRLCSHRDHIRICTWTVWDFDPIFFMEIQGILHFSALDKSLLLCRITLYSASISRSEISQWNGANPHPKLQRNPPIQGENPQRKSKSITLDSCHSFHNRFLWWKSVVWTNPLRPQPKGGAKKLKIFICLPVFFFCFNYFMTRPFFSPSTPIF